MARREIDYSKIELLVLDVDGVMTDGRIVLTPSGEEIKAFHVRDGSGIKYWCRCGKKVAIISGRGSPAVALRAKELGIDTFRVNAKDKLPAFREVLEQLGSTPERTAVMGDDLTDLPLLRRCALPIAVADAVEEVRQEAAYVTKLSGGQGAVREAIEMILKKTGQWATVLKRYEVAGEETSG